MANDESEGLGPKQWTSERYAKLTGFEGDWRDLWFNEDFVELMARRWALSEVHTLLDVGCGVGHWGQRLVPYLPADGRLIGIDRDESFAKKASARAVERNIGQRCEYKAAQAEALPFESDTFDAVTCQTVLMHVADPMVAIAEMMRVLKPGGILIAVEPNNQPNLLIEAGAHPKSDWSQTLDLLDFERTCTLGKIALGEGDSYIGEVLPGMFHRAGLADLKVFSNDKCPALIPPYVTPEEALDIEMTLGWIDEGVWAYGTKADVRRYFEAGKGDLNRFDGLWEQAMKERLELKKRLLARELTASRGFVHYLISGRKPGTVL